MRIRSGPETELDPLFIFFAGVIPERDIELVLHLRIAFPMSLGESEERSVARVICQRLRQRVSFRQIEAEVLEPGKEFRLVCVEKSVEFHASGIRAPFEQ